ncbi:S8 family serine peptidase [Paractinoplanes hotanensis]|uniref:S8 family serine peptidase n=1 Tax=Paractinoplanes hotanensis TaxID=2906497 RepID=A0ABT0YE39_9ACTN|nr:S8 family serine peptidase [Actinoplanes hotanensis]MCM4083777.1 S8 family serine peptidase [Actinoplanes hotanensis]
MQPESLLPAVVSQTRPVRVVSTSIDRGGRPAVSVRTATDRDTASALVVAGQHAPGAISVEADVPVSVAATDPLLPMQWDLARVRADGAWLRSTGAGVTVAVVDSGVDASHPDLAGHVLPGADFITGTEGTAVDPHGHGTHVAGTVAALTGNGVGIAGMAPDAQILPVRVLDANGNGYMSDVANGIAYAAEHGADVINLSVSATSQVGAVTNAVAYARSKGVVVVAAGGNSRRTGSPTAFPAADPGVIAVAATASDDAVAAYSNRGGYIDVAAPGSEITSVYPGNRYVRMSGTSMAAPHVTALTALLKGADRGLTPDEVERAVTESAVDLGEPGRDDDFGAGRLDAAAAFATLTPARPSPSEAVPTQTITPPPATATTPTVGAPLPHTTNTPPGSDTPSPYGSEAPRGGDTPPSESNTPPAGDTPSPHATTTPPRSDTPQSPGTKTPTPTPRVPAEATPTPAAPIVRLVRPGPGRLFVFVIGVESVPVQIQRHDGDGWTTVLTYPATKVARFDGLVPGVEHRVVVSGATSDVIRL